MTRSRPERGFVLLIVLMAVGLLALLTAQLTASARNDAVTAAKLRDAAVAGAAAEGGIADAAFVLLTGGAGAVAFAAGEPLVVAAGAARVRIDARPMGLTINPNTDPPVTLTTNLREAGVEPALAARLSDAIRGWHSPGGVRGFDDDAYRAAGLRYGPARAPFGTADELGLVLGMTPTALAAIRPRLDLYSAPSLGDPRAGGVGVPNQPVMRTMEVAAVAVTAGATARRTATLLVRDRPEQGAPLVSVLEWGDGD